LLLGDSGIGTTLGPDILVLSLLLPYRPKKQRPNTPHPFTSSAIQPMGEITFTGLPEETHHCTSHQEGDWIVWRCPQCERYERRFNARTGEMKIVRGSSAARHTGTSNGAQNMKALTRIQSFN